MKWGHKRHRRVSVRALWLGLGALLAGCGEGRQVPAAAPQPAATTAPAVAPRASPPPAAGHRLDAAQVARGAEVYARHCAECHGPRGAGAPGDWRKPGPDGKYPPPPLDDSAHAWHHPTEVLRKVIRKGSPPGMGNMPAWEGKLGERDIDDVVAYIKSLWSDEVHARWQQIETQSKAN